MDYSEGDDLALKNLLDEWNLVHHYKYFLGKNDKI